ncbi:L,D-transpeptidase family protein [Luteipulveratus flavus]|uniref:L,D-transpeptidase family protein n=1 Tax=Luteipulveratus flavus TaxID=3031728 RepID=A0ABT6C7U7_9MICO|nr:L,D-transpeptidase family protein [Luteipulveratus sp. YIM 133296]MDF8265009.1 L,D-transpeptidase family protein [Luteipulveratus sp. YIM 133296]
MTNIKIDRRQALQGAAVAGTVGAIGIATAGRADAAVRPTAAPASAPTAVVAATYPTLKRGSTGTAVKDLQTKLSGAGYWLGSVDGSFGHLTQQAVWAIQKYWGLSRDGVVGPLTWGKVNLRQRPKSRYTTTRIEVDKARQLMFVVSSGAVQLCLNTSTGANKPFESGGHWYDGRTPSGTFKVFRYVPGWYHGALGDLYRPMFFNGGIAIHGSTSIPPYNASHGCCRLSTAAQDTIIARGALKIGATVTVY